MAKLVHRLDVLPGIIDEAVAEAISETADFILAIIYLTVPVDTGRLKKSYKVEQVNPLYVIIGSTVLYSIFVEFGTYKMSAQPHFGPAFALAEHILQQRIISKIKAKI